MVSLSDAVRGYAAQPDLAGLVEQARTACTELRWHEALRRRIPEAAAESRVRGAAASSELEGAPISAVRVRNIVMGVSTISDRDPADRVALGAIAATAETEALRSVVLTAPLQALARLHMAASARYLPAEQVGRPRVAGETCLEYADLGPAPEAGEVAATLRGIVELVRAAGELPVLLVAAVVHAELMRVRPFVGGNGVVARAVERLLLEAGGLDPTGVSVPERGHLAAGVGYLGALAAYASGEERGVRLWLDHAAGAAVAGAAEGRAVADAVRAGRLG